MPMKAIAGISNLPRERGRKVSRFIRERKGTTAAARGKHLYYRYVTVSIVVSMGGAVLFLAVTYTSMFRQIVANTTESKDGVGGRRSSLATIIATDKAVAPALVSESIRHKIANDLPTVSKRVNLKTNNKDTVAKDMDRIPELLSDRITKDMDRTPGLSDNRIEIKNANREKQGVEKNNEALKIVARSPLPLNIKKEETTPKNTKATTQDPLPTTETVNKIIYEWKKQHTAITNNDKTNLDKNQKHPIANIETVPSILIFTYHTDLLKKPQTHLPYSHNILHTIKAYRTSLPTPPTVKFYTDDDCVTVLNSVRPALAPAFLAERNGQYKADICRAAALYLHGGYYFDVDLQVVTPFVVPSGVKFVTVVEEPGRGFFQAFVAATPRHDVLRLTLEKMVEYYRKALRGNRIDGSVAAELLREEPGWKMGTRTIKDAYTELRLPHRGEGVETYFLQEIKLDFHRTWYVGLKRRNLKNSCCCNYVVHDPGRSVVHFWSRIVGSTYCGRGRLDVLVDE